jgi:hypothetical protein
MTAWVIAIGGVVIALLATYFLGLTKGAGKERQKQAEDRLEAVADKKEKDDEVDQLAPADVDERFNRWMRDKR